MFKCTLNAEMLLPMMMNMQEQKSEG